MSPKLEEFWERIVQIPKIQNYVETDFPSLPDVFIKTAGCTNDENDKQG